MPFRKNLTNVQFAKNDSKHLSLLFFFGTGGNLVPCHAKYFAWQNLYFLKISSKHSVNSINLGKNICEILQMNNPIKISSIKAKFAEKTAAFQQKKTRNGIQST